MKKILCLVFFSFLIPGSPFAQNNQKGFEGSVHFNKIVGIDTSEYIYYVKDNSVRIDEFDSKTKNISISRLIDLTQKTVINIKHDLKICISQTPEPPADIKGNVQVKKTENARSIQNVECTEYIVKNEEENTEISFFISNRNEYPFYDRLLNILNRKDHFSLYYLKIAGLRGFFPLIAIERTLDGKEIGRMEAIKMEKKTLDTPLFEIPSGYAKLGK